MTDRFMDWWAERPAWQLGLAFFATWAIFGASGVLIMGPAAGFCMAPLVYREIVAFQREGREGKSWLGRSIDELREWIGDLGKDLGKPSPDLDGCEQIIPTPTVPDHDHEHHHHAAGPAPAAPVAAQPVAAPPRVPGRHRAPVAATAAAAPPERTLE